MKKGLRTLVSFVLTKTILSSGRSIVLHSSSPSFKTMAYYEYKSFGKNQNLLPPFLFYAKEKMLRMLEETWYHVFVSND